MLSAHGQRRSAFFFRLIGRECTVNGAGSTWSKQLLHLYVGVVPRQRDAEHPPNGSIVSKLPTGYIGSAAGSTGAVAVDGSRLDVDKQRFLDVGVLGNGTLNITGGARHQ